MIRMTSLKDSARVQTLTFGDLSSHILRRVRNSEQLNLGGRLLFRQADSSLDSLDSQNQKRAREMERAA